MNKKLFLGMFAAAGMLFATSCSNDELDMVQSGNEAQVTFSLGLEGGIDTRAISDGKSADVLMYAVFDEEGNRINTIQKVSRTGVTFPTTENITLAKGQTYKVAFWAQDEDCEAYTVSDDMKVTVNYDDKNKGNNDETRDAFFKTVEFTVTGSTSIDVELKRPFAQINVGVYKTDWEAAVKSGIEIQESSVVIKNAATSINLLTGEVGDETTDVKVSYSSNRIPNEDLKVDLNGDGDYDDENEVYKWLSMSYILVADRNADTDDNGVLGDERATLESLQYTFSPIVGNDITFGDGLNSVPVQRNWRTNILGQLLTGNIEFNITINPIFEGDINVENPTSIIYATTQDELENATIEDNATIFLAAGKYTIPSSAKGKTLTIKGTGNPEDVEVAVTKVGTGYENVDYGLDGSTVTFEGITITTNSSTYIGYARCKGTYKNCVINGTYTLYGDSKFDNCTFNVSGDVYNIWTWGAPNATFDGCTFNSDGKAMLLYGAENTNLTINNCTFNDNGGLDVKKAAIEIGDDYGSSYELIVNNTVVNGFAINDEGINTGTTLWANKNSMPKDKLSVTVDGVENPIYANSQDELAKATIENNATIFLAAGKYTIPSSAKGKTLTIKGTGNPEDVEVAVTKVGTGYENVDYGLDGSTVTFEGITITTNSSTYIGYARCKGTYKNCVINGTYTLYGDSKFDNCTFNVSGDVYNIWTWGAPNATFDGCTFNSDGKAMLLYGAENTNLTINNCTFNDNEGLIDLKKAAIEIGDDYGSSYELTVNKTVVNGFAINDEGINTNTTLWANKNSMGTDKLSVTVDGVKVY